MKRKKKGNCGIIRQVAGVWKKNFSLRSKRRNPHTVLKLSECGDVCSRSLPIAEAHDSLFLSGVSDFFLSPLSIYVFGGVEKSRLLVIILLEGPKDALESQSMKKGYLETCLLILFVYFGWIFQVR